MSTGTVTGKVIRVDLKDGYKGPGFEFLKVMVHNGEPDGYFMLSWSTQAVDTKPIFDEALENKSEVTASGKLTAKLSDKGPWINFPELQVRSYELDDQTSDEPRGGGITESDITF